MSDDQPIAQLVVAYVQDGLVMHVELGCLGEEYNRMFLQRKIKSGHDIKNREIN
jgi:hypothetical protein